MLSVNSVISIYRSYVVFIALVPHPAVNECQSPSISNQFESRSMFPPSSESETGVADDLMTYDLMTSEIPISEQIKYTLYI